MAFAVQAGDEAGRVEVAAGREVIVSGMESGVGSRVQDSFDAIASGPSGAMIRWLSKENTQCSAAPSRM